LDDRYDQRPSAWIEPQGDWGKGTVNLVEIPTADETNDNIVAFWKPESLPEAGQPIDFSYRLHWSNDEKSLGSQELASVKQTLRSTGDVKQSNLIREPDGSIAYLVDFEGPALKALLEDAPVRSELSLDSNAELLENNVRYNPNTKGWRLTLRFKVKDPSKPVEMRAALVKDLPVEAPAAVDEGQRKTPPAPAKKAAPAPAETAASATPTEAPVVPATDVPAAPIPVQVLSETWSNQLPADD
jgi:glucans biosynthesis protein